MRKTIFHNNLIINSSYEPHDPRDPQTPWSQQQKRVKHTSWCLGQFVQAAPRLFPSKSDFLNSVGSLGHLKP